MKIVFFGTPHFAAEILKDLVQKKYDITAVVTRVDKPKGRGKTVLPTPVKEAAFNFNPLIPVFQPEKASSPEFIETLQALQADLFIVVAFGEIISQKVLDLPKFGCINVHASLLPEYRGAAPIQRCVIDGRKESGITVMQMVRKMDAGDMMNVIKVPLTLEMSFGDLEAKLLEAGKIALDKTVREIENGTLIKTPQNENEVTFAPKIELEECEINWDRPALLIHNLIRGVNPYPGAWVWVQTGGETKRLKIWKSRLVEENETCSPNCVIVNCQPGRLELLEVQLEGKKRMSMQDLLRGLSKAEFKGVPFYL